MRFPRFWCNACAVALVWALSFSLAPSFGADLVRISRFWVQCMQCTLMWNLSFGVAPSFDVGPWLLVRVPGLGVDALRWCEPLLLA